MIAALDIGNSALKLGWLEGSEVRRSEAVEGLGPETGIAWVEERLRGEAFAAIAIACVVPAWRSTLERLSALAPLGFAGEASLRSRAHLAPNVSGLGADRWMAAEAAAAEGRAAIAVTAGTATTFTAIASDGALLGGAIAPGLGIGADALARAGAQLFAVPFVAPSRALGAATTAALQSGLVLGHAALIRGMVERLEAELGGPQAVVLTGGWSQLLQPLLPSRFERDPHLVLRGLARAAKLTWGLC